MAAPSLEECRALWLYHGSQYGAAMRAKPTQTLEQWAQDGIRNPAPLLDWYAKDYLRYLARKNKVKVKVNTLPVYGFAMADGLELSGPDGRKTKYKFVDR